MSGKALAAVILASASIISNPVIIHTEQPIEEVQIIPLGTVPEETAIKEDRPVKIFFISKQDRELIERVVAAEARGESYEGQAAVAEVIFNRAYFWDMTVSEVVTAKGQFAKAYPGEISDSIKEAVSSVFDSQKLNLSGATHFHADYVCPGWSLKKEFVTQIGVHKFYK